jgi:hypothetical protein
MKTLTLTVSRPSFDMIIAGIKTQAFFPPLPTYKNLVYKNGEVRLYDAVKFVINNDNDKSFAICEYLGVSIVEKPYTLTYPNNLKIKVNAGDFLIEFGKVLQYLL